MIATRQKLDFGAIGLGRQLTRTGHGWFLDSSNAALTVSPIGFAQHVFEQFAGGGQR
jgi:hypothetical protein